MNIPSIEHEHIAGKKVLLRLDLNVPIKEGKVLDPYRIDQVISTIDLLRHKKARIIIVAHTETKDNTSLYPMFDYLKGFMPLQFIEQLFTKEANIKIASLKDGEVVLCENIRNYEGEKANDEGFSKQLASLADIYVNDAFSVSHREHASVVGIPKFLPHFAGPLFIDEVHNISRAFNPSHPFLFILGGAKFDTKLPIIKKYLEKADFVFVAGALANNIFKAKGYEVGISLVSDGNFGIEDLLQNPKFMYPIDVLVRASNGGFVNKKNSEVLADDYIADVGPETLDMLKKKVSESTLVVWNGPLGNYEIGCKDMTEQLAFHVAVSHVTSILGGGDTLASIQSLGILNKFSFVSTAGGAMIDFLVNETLPGIEALTAPQPTH